MNRNECETKIREKLQEIIDIYKQYHPEGTYLSLTFNGGCLYGNNKYYDTTSTDYDKVIHFYMEQEEDA